jgi:hypothetical protein
MKQTKMPGNVPTLATRVYCTFLKGTVLPDYKCLEVISVKISLLGHVTPDIYINFNSPLIFNRLLQLLTLSDRHVSRLTSYFADF